MVEICPTVWHGSKPLDPFVEFLGSIQGILLVQGTLVGLKVLDVFGQPGCDLLVVKELRENGDFESWDFNDYGVFKRIKLNVYEEVLRRLKNTFNCNKLKREVRRAGGENVLTFTCNEKMLSTVPTNLWLLRLTGTADNFIFIIKSK